MSDVMVLGGSSGIGLSTVIAFKNKSLSVLVVSRNAEDNTVLKQQGIVSKNVDMMNAKAMEHLFAQVSPKYVVVTPTLMIAKRNIAGTLIPKLTNNAINGMVKSLALEIAPVRINAISPGLTDTPMVAKMKKEDPQTINHMVQEIPLKRIAKPNETTEAILLAAINENITGNIIDCGGGSNLL